MTTLTAISFNLVGGIGVFAVTLTAFGVAVKRQNTFVAARCEARPRVVIYNPNPKHPCQNRGNPTLGWILWVMRLTYDTMLRGVPGTGTRDGGLSGALLKVNLDGIVLLRFHHLCLRVCCLAAFLYLLVVLPIYATAGCYQLQEDLDSDSDFCLESNLTDYQELTLANIPALEPVDSDSFRDIMLFFFLPQHDGVLAKLYVVVFCSWIVTWYALRELQVEWGDVLAMRRVYYLEANHWKDRNEELQELQELQETGLRDEREKNNGRTTKDDGDDSHLTIREPWVVHPEQRDTVPNVELYSILVGGLPSLPTEVVDEEEVEAVFSRKQSIDWQLAVTTAFFDHCVPNQPGFSSSIAAVTILPAAAHLTEAWNQWYKAASKLRRLRFIRRQIADRRRDEIDDKAYPESEDPEQPPPLKPATLETLDRQQTEKKMHYQEILGSDTDLEVENNLLHAMNFGPEQTAVYSREFAMGAANLAPHGFFEGRIRRAGIDELLEMEKIATAQVREANQDLRIAQEKIAESSEGDGLSEEDLTMIMMTTSTHGTPGAEPSKDVDETPLTRNTSGNLSKSSSRGSLSSRCDVGHSKARLNNSIEYSTDGDDSFNDDSSGDDHIDYDMPLKDDCSPGKETEVPISKPTLFARASSMPVDAGYRSDESKSERRSALGENKQMSFLNWTGLVRNTSSEDLDSSRKQRRPPKRATVESAQLPGDLGLEAGLWMEQRNVAMGGSQRGSTPRRANSFMSRSGHIPRGSPSRRAPPRRTRSSDELDLFSEDPQEIAPSLPTPAPPHRVKSSDDIDLLAEAWLDGGPPKELTLNSSQIHRSPTTPKADDNLLQRALSYTRKVDEYDTGESGLQNARWKTGESKPGIEQGKPSATRSDSIWSRLEKDKERKERLRERLVSMQSSQRSSSVNSDGERRGLSQGSSFESSSQMPQAPSVEPDNLKSADQDSTGLASSKRTDDNAETAEKVASGGNVPPSCPQNREYRSNTSRREYCSNADNQSLASLGNRVNAQDVEGSNSQQIHSNSLLRSHVPVPIPTSTYVPGDEVPRPLPPPRMPLIDELALNEDDLSIDFKAETFTAGLGYKPHDMEASYRSQTSHQAEDNLRIALDFEKKAGLRKRETNNGSQQRLNNKRTDKWSKVMSIVQESTNDAHSVITKERLISSGRWKIPTYHGLVLFCQTRLFSILNWLKCSLKPPDLVDDLSRDSTYAVLTFTSRQAAVAARHCLADSRGADRWVTVSEIPSPPLADAPVCNVSSFRGCVRPVTMSISDKQKILRHQLALAALAAIYFFYTIPLTAAQQLVSPENLSKIFPDIERLQESSIFLSNLFSGFIPALVWTGFFAICPPMFKIIANFGSNATSSVTAENSALHYFWWFMVVSAFTGTSFSTAVVNGFNEGIQIGSEIQKVVATAAATIPTQVSATWLNWMIVRSFVVLPTQYLLQLNTFLFSWVGLTCCTRTVRGGGAGAPVPYRIYVDSGVVMLCVFALAPASPLIAAAALVYFLFCTPLLRWTMIFLYKPKFDIGGQRFPFIFDICVSGMVVGQILLIAMMSLKRAIGPAFGAFFPLIPTIWFRYFVRKRYLRAFNDAALLQTSLLDGWDTNEETCEEKREEFRLFLVDCHKAAYVPVCIAGDESTTITAEPAVVVPFEMDEDIESMYGDISSKKESLPSQQPRVSHFQPNEHQPGQMLRRTSGVVKQRALARSLSGGLDGASLASDALTCSGFSPMSKSYGSPRHTKSYGSPRHTTGKRIISSGAPFYSPLTTYSPILSKGFPKTPAL